MKSALIFEAKKNERVYQFVAPVGSPFGECYDVLHEMLVAITEEVKKATEAAKRKEEEEKKEEAA